MTKLESRIIKILRPAKRGLGTKELAKKLGIGKKSRIEFNETMERLLSEYVLLKQNGRYHLIQNMGLKKAEIIKVTGTFGFARPIMADSSKQVRDVFIPGRRLSGTMPGDQVLIKESKGMGDLPEGDVIAILSQKDAPFSCVLAEESEGLFVIPDRYVKFPIRVDMEHPFDAKPGDKVLAVISRRGERHSHHTVRILEVYGDAGKAASCCASILAENGVRLEFPPEVLEQAHVVTGGTGIHPKELEQRLDLRNDTIFTIDGADAKDLDDAVSLKKLPEGWELGVHIADVSYYVTHKSPLDEEAYLRGTSVYYADSVVPMLPKELSNGICSLNPNEDRLAFSALLRLDESAGIVSYHFQKSVIRSMVKGVYSEVNSLLEGSSDKEIAAKYAGLEDTLQSMRSLAELMTKNRYARGGVDLESVETKLIIGEDGVCTGIAPRERGISERIIEEFMLAANEAAATFALEHALPSLFRIHDAPAPDKLQTLYSVLDSLGVKRSRSGQTVTPGAISAIVDGARDSALYPIISALVLRTMAKAKYSAGNTGHFGLALKNYTHFTSPIRRYPDLVTHRVLSGFVTGMKYENIQKRFERFTSESAIQSTEREIAAMAAERDCEDCYKAEYMTRFVGQEFDGQISAVTAFGLYVRLENTVEGLVRLSELPGSGWGFDGIISLTEAVTGRTLRLGDRVRVKIEGTDISAGQIDMALA